MAIAATKSFELGVYTFGNTPTTVEAGSAPTAQAIRNALQAIRLADEAGLDFFGFGEHHTRSMPISSPTSIVNASCVDL
jgi:alkanesulfonate monooxygenase SsuD/methylene tetrahydromethanopterin reductase-like flavin-dependent oxidoreductase (luciferase family)